MPARTTARLLTLALLLTALLGLAVLPVGAQSGSNTVVILRLEGPLNPIWQSYLTRGFGAAQQQQASAVIIELNTPGGSIDLMTKLIQQIRSSPIPVVVYVSPNGSMAGSAGTMLTLAGHLAAMAPETAIGAASPVGSNGQDISATEDAKVKEILKATIRSLAENRKPAAVTLAENMIDNAQAVSASEALAAGLIDFKAASLDDLLTQMDGRTVTVNHQPLVLHTAGARQVTIPISFIEQFLQVLTDPNLVFVLLAVGVQAILIEISNPGGWIPGFIGIVALTLAVYGLGILPVNWFGLVFIVVAFVLFLLDIKAPTHGALTAAGVASFIIGALVLFNSPNVPSFERVSVPLVVGTGFFIGAIFFTIVMFALRAQRRPVLTGLESLSLVGQVGIARGDLSPSGPVQLGNELWTARLSDPTQQVRAGARVRVVAMDGLQVRVQKVDD